MTRNPYHPDTNRTELVTRLPRPSKAQAAFAEASPEALEIAQSWWDERCAHVQKMAEIRARMTEQDAETARAGQSALIQF